jgi:hypothetical protein
MAPISDLLIRTSVHDTLIDAGGDSMKRRTPSETLIVLILAYMITLPGATAAILHCDDVTTLDFGNLTIASGTRKFVFKDGTALNHDAKGDSSDADWKAEIARDTVVQPAPGVTVRFLLIHDSHMTGSGWRYYLLGYCCSNSKLQEVFRRDGLSLEVERTGRSCCALLLMRCLCNTRFT